MKQCHDEFLGCLMLMFSRANRDRYAGFKSDLNNQYGLARTCTLNHRIYAFFCSIADRMQLSDNLARTFKLLLKSNRKTKHLYLYLLKECLTRKLYRSQKKTDPRVLHHLRHQPANLVTVLPMLNARNVANLVTSPSIALRKRKRLLLRRSML